MILEGERGEGGEQLVGRQAARGLGNQRKWAPEC